MSPLPKSRAGIEGFLWNSALNRNNQPIEMRILINLKDTVATDVLIGCLPIGARHFTKSHVISPGFVRERVCARAKKPPLPQDGKKLVA
jgi:hypothetical protein